MARAKKWNPDVRRLREGYYDIASEKDDGVRYVVRKDGERWVCNCPAGRRGEFCKHQGQVLKVINGEENLAAAQIEAPFMTSLPKEQKEPPEKLLKGVYRFDEVTSALQKEIRRGDEEAAVYWAMILYSSSPQYLWKRLMVTAAEDIGLADPETVHRVYTLALGWKMSKESSWYVSPHSATMAVVLLCRAPKSTEIEDFQSYTLEAIKQGVKREMPQYAIDGHTKQGKEKKIPWGQWYAFRHKTAGIPVNKWTRKLAEINPVWFEGAEDIFDE
jgi:replication-associated recombination protein RarA